MRKTFTNGLFAICALFIGLLDIAHANSLESVKNVDKKISMLVVGDSWAHFMCTYHSLSNLFYRKKINRWTSRAHPDNKIELRGCGKNGTIKMGAETTDMLSEKFLSRIVNKLKVEPQLKIVYLSIGGNDLLGKWNVKMSEEEEQKIFDKIFDNTKKIVQTMFETKPDIRVVISGYDFPNFTSDTGYAKISSYRNMYNRMGRPTPEELNSMLVRFSLRMQEISNCKKVAYVHHLGVMAYHYGYLDYLVFAHKTMPPSEISSCANPENVGGIVQYETDREAMAKVRFFLSLFYDPFHLSRSGYYFIAEHTYDVILKDWLTELEVL